jgi:hypothetical protein
VRIFRSKSFIPIFASSRCTSGCLLNWSRRPLGAFLLESACESAVACCHASSRFRLACGRDMSWLYFGIPQKQVATATPWVSRISLSSLMIWASAIFFESLTPALIQPSIAAGRRSRSRL